MADFLLTCCMGYDTRGRLTRKGNIPWRGRLSHWCIIHPATLTPEGIDLTWWYYTLERYRKVRIFQIEPPFFCLMVIGPVDLNLIGEKSRWTVTSGYDHLPPYPPYPPPPPHIWRLVNHKALRDLAVIWPPPATHCCQVPWRLFRQFFKNFHHLAKIFRYRFLGQN